MAANDGVSPAGQAAIEPSPTRRAAIKPMKLRHVAVAAVARFGYLTHGIIYLMVGTLAAVAAFDWRAQTTDAYGALAVVLSHPSGKILLATLAAGLVAFSFWSVLQSLADTERLGKNAMALFVRIGFLGSGIGHLLLCVAALNLIFGWQPASANAEAEIKDWTFWAFAMPGGRWAVGLAGLFVITAAVAVVRTGWRGDFRSRLIDDYDVRCLAVPFGRVGLIAQGATFGFLGCFLLAAAFQADPATARGMAGVLGTLRQQPHGWVLLAVVALGLVTYGVYGLIQSICRRIDPPRQMG